MKIVHKKERKERKKMRIARGFFIFVSTQTTKRQTKQKLLLTYIDLMFWGVI